MTERNAIFDKPEDIYLASDSLRLKTIKCIHAALAQISGGMGLDLVEYGEPAKIGDHSFVKASDSDVARYYEYIGEQKKGEPWREIFPLLEVFRGLSVIPSYTDEKSYVINIKEHVEFDRDTRQRQFLSSSLGEVAESRPGSEIAGEPFPILIQGYPSPDSVSEFGQKSRGQTTDLCYRFLEAVKSRVGEFLLDECHENGVFRISSKFNLVLRGRIQGAIVTDEDGLGFWMFVLFYLIEDHCNSSIAVTEDY